MLLKKKPGQDFVPMINLLLPTTLQPTFRTDPEKARTGFCPDDQPTSSSYLATDFSG